MLFSEFVMQSDLDDKEGHEYLDGILNMVPTEMRGFGVWRRDDSSTTQVYIYLYLGTCTPRISLCAALQPILHDFEKESCTKN